MIGLRYCVSLAAIFILAFVHTTAFSPAIRCNTPIMIGARTYPRKPWVFQMTEEGDQESDDGVVELATDEEKETSSAAAPFLSQGEILDESLNPDLSDPKQTRVIIYIIISLIPVLFLIPLMIGSRDFIPPDSLPPVTM